jgi:AP-1 complex subunit beta-1
VWLGEPTLSLSTLQVFFCKYNDPAYVKMEKLDIMMKLVNEKNIDQARLANNTSAFLRLYP